MKSFMNFIQNDDPDEKVKPVFLLAGNPGHMILYSYLEIIKGKLICNYLKF